MRALSIKKPISMLIHTSFKIDHHELIADKVQNYIKYLKDNYNDEIVNQFKNLYNQEMSVMNRPLFINGMEDYSTPENIPEYPSWDSIKMS